MVAVGVEILFVVEREERRKPDGLDRKGTRGGNFGFHIVIPGKFGIRLMKECQLTGLRIDLAFIMVVRYVEVKKPVRTPVPRESRVKIEDDPSGNEFLSKEA